MEGNVPYGWQPKGEYIEIRPSKTKRINIFGLMSLEAYSFKGSGTSLDIITFIDDFATNLKRRTAIVLDNAPIHHSAIFDAKVIEWQKMDLYVFFLPAYSPPLNPIEILWRKIKYEWLEYENIINEDQLEEQLVSILSSFGSEYTIDFNELKVSIN
jgi:transposase